MQNLTSNEESENIEAGRDSMNTELALKPARPRPGEKHKYETVRQYHLGESASKNRLPLVKREE